MVNQKWYTATMVPNSEEHMFAALNWEQITIYSTPEMEVQPTFCSMVGWFLGTTRITALISHELHTIICDCEVQTNSRPLTYLPEDKADPVPLTSSMFLQEL
ncbi:hypothetical protein PR048_012932 [Dryococelus australis]|uniref:Uncharacterized protein n=1 Tax=Dryococelus australis TaxID=614101 RepID=A0ABQ9HRF8_9NEOP|nr:hypothetical protein PR048_012932 [Dryococelus australis]